MVIRNEINSRQNQKRTLEYQVISRIKLKKANNILFLSITINIVVVLIGFLLIGKNHHRITMILVVFSFFIGVYLNRLCRSYVEESALLKEEFDRYVFGWTDSLPPLSVDHTILIESNQSTIISQIESTGDDKARGVRDWYEDVNDAECPFNAIRKAMMLNLVYDKRLKKQAKIIVSVLVLMSVLISLLLCKDLTIDSLIIIIVVSMGPITQILFDLILGIYDIEKINSKIESKLNSSKNIDDLKSLISEFTKKRSIVTFDLDFLHMIFKRKTKVQQKNKQVL